MKEEKVYAIYKGDEFIDLGTKKELAERLGVKVRTIEYLLTPAYRRKFKKSKNNGENRMIAIRLEE